VVKKQQWCDPLAKGQMKTKPLQETQDGKEEAKREEIILTF
jgi:hypothetical protein